MGARRPTGNTRPLSPDAGSSTYSNTARAPTALQGYLTYEKTHPSRTLPWAHASGPKGVLGGWVFSCGRFTPVGTLRARGSALAALDAKEGLFLVLPL